MKKIKKNIIKQVICCFFFIYGYSTAEAHPGVGIVMDSKGNVFYTDLNHVWRITPDGNQSIVVKNIHTHELYIDEQDNLYGEHEWYKGENTDKWGNYVWRLKKNGEFKKIIPEVEGILDNNTLVRDAKGNSYWVNKSEEVQLINIQSINGDNSLFSTHKFTDIRWMYFSKENKCLYVVDNLKIKKVSPSGKVELIANNLKEKTSPYDGVADRHYIFGIATDTSKNVYVATFGARKVKKISRNGIVSTIYQSDSGWSPCGVLVGIDKTLWIMEFSKNNKTRIVRVNNHRERKFFGR